MPHVNVNIPLENGIKKGETISFDYPKGKNEASFFGAFNHNLVANDLFYKSPVDFVIIPKHDKLELHWQHDTTLPKKTILYARLEELGTTYYYDDKNNVTVQGMVRSNVFMVNLHAPVDKKRNHYVEKTNVESACELELVNDAPDVPRNVTLLSTGHDIDRTFIIDGFDAYERPMTEYISGPNAGIRHGRKAFAKVTKIRVDGPCKGSIQVGFGNRLGIPVYLPAQGYVVNEMINGKIPPSGVIRTGYIGAPAPDSGDRRGTYTPSPLVKLDGRSALYLLLSLPNPGNIGSPDYHE